MKNRKFRILNLLSSLIISVSLLCSSVCADAPLASYDNGMEAEIVFEHDIEENSNENGRITVGKCTHYGYIYFTEVSHKYQGKLRAQVIHRKATVNSCTHMMNWTIEYVVYAKSSGIVLHPSRTRSGTLAIGLSNYEEFAGPSGTIFEYRLITSVAGVTDKTDWKRIEFRII